MSKQNWRDTAKGEYTRNSKNSEKFFFPIPTARNRFIQQNGI